MRHTGALRQRYRRIEDLLVAGCLWGSHSDSLLCGHWWEVVGVAVTFWSRWWCLRYLLLIDVIICFEITFTRLMFILTLDTHLSILRVYVDLCYCLRICKYHMNIYQPAALTHPCREQISSRWRHNGHHGVSNHQPHDYLLNRLFRHKSKKTSKLRVTGLCAGNSPGTGKFPAQRASYAENVSIWWRHHVQ